MTPENPIVGGTILRIPAISSPNFVQGSTGWSIQQNGDAFFADVTITGGNVVVAGANGGVFVYSGTPATGNLVASVAGMAGTDAYGNAYPEGFASYGTGSIAGVTALFNAGVLEWTDSLWSQGPMISPGVPSATNPLLTITSPTTTSDYAQIQLSGGGPMPIGASEVVLTADEVSLSTYSNGIINFSTNSTGFGLIFTDTPIQKDDSWTNLTVGGNWSAGSSLNYYHGLRVFKDAAGVVHLDGNIVAGVSGGITSTNIATLPAGYSPSTNKIFVMVYTANTPKVADFIVQAAGVFTMSGELGSSNGGTCFVTAEWPTTI